MLLTINYRYATATQTVIYDIRKILMHRIMNTLIAQQIHHLVSNT